MNHKVLWCDLNEKDNEVTIHLERLDNGERIDIIVPNDKPETWDASMEEATRP
jgi:hypothetical protein